MSSISTDELHTECHGCPEKLNTIRRWVFMALRKKSEVFVSECTYPCIISKGSVKVRTVICLPKKLPDGGIITINKPCTEVGIEDVLTLYTRLNCNS